MDACANVYCVHVVWIHGCTGSYIHVGGKEQCIETRCLHVVWMHAHMWQENKDGWMDGWMDGRSDGCINELMYVFMYVCCVCM